MSTVNEVEAEKTAMAEIGRHWGVLLFMGIASIVLGIVIMVWPGKSVVVVAVLLAIYLVVMGIFEIIRGFGHGLSGGNRALLFIGGALSLILGLFAFRGFRLEDSPLNAVWLLAVFIAISFIFRGIAQLMMAGESKDGRGWNIFGGIVSLLLGIIILVTPATIEVLAWLMGIWLVIGGIFFIIGSFQVKKLAS
jgi:uncharacterized membrane protein HdeD (DUF308 family)